MGRKVTILYRIEGDPVNPFSEVVGVVRKVEGGSDEPVLHVTKRDGTAVSVPAAQIVSLKEVPDRR